MQITEEMVASMNAAELVHARKLMADRLWGDLEYGLPHEVQKVADTGDMIGAVKALRTASGIGLVAAAKAIRCYFARSAEAREARALFLMRQEPAKPPADVVEFIRHELRMAGFERRVMTPSPIVDQPIHGVEIGTLRGPFKCGIGHDANGRVAQLPDEGVQFCVFTAKGWAYFIEHQSKESVARARAEEFREHVLSEQGE